MLRGDGAKVWTTDIYGSKGKRFGKPKIASGVDRGPGEKESPGEVCQCRQLGYLHGSMAFVSRFQGQLNERREGCRRTGANPSD
jgi:hypothetical protein